VFDLLGGREEGGEEGGKTRMDGNQCPDPELVSIGLIIIREREMGEGERWWPLTIDEVWLAGWLFWRVMIMMK
jgi:hypothetical protein